jgi:hypothetical protein
VQSANADGPVPIENIWSPHHEGTDPGAVAEGAMVGVVLDGHAHLCHGHPQDCCAQKHCLRHREGLGGLVLLLLSALQAAPDSNALS